MPDSLKNSLRKATKKSSSASRQQAPKIKSPKPRTAAAKAHSPFAVLVKKLKKERGVAVAKVTPGTESGWVPLGHERALQLAREVGIITRSGKLSSRYK